MREKESWAEGATHSGRRRARALTLIGHQFDLLRIAAEEEAAALLLAGWEEWGRAAVQGLPLNRWLEVRCSRTPTIHLCTGHAERSVRAFLEIYVRKLCQ